LAIGLLALAVSTAAAGQETLEARIDALARHLADHTHAGLSVLVARGDAILLSRGYGLANVEHAATASPDTIYHIDSITKHVTAVALLQLAQAGKLSLDDALSRYLPELPQAAGVRLRMLLNHTSGIASFSSTPGWAPREREDWTPARLLAFLKPLPRDFSPGTAWRYNNSGFYLAVWSSSASPDALTAITCAITSSDRPR
jgi:CubicO group peptidase (beta-lactamase class C family)